MKGYLILETGETYEGFWNGGADRAGEVVFNTSHSGYEEIATDPSYLNQIVVMTSPMQGNYGVSDEVWESKRIWIEGFICVEIQQSKSNSFWLDRLREHKVPTLSKIDTRNLVLRLRSGGTPIGALVQAESLESAKQKSIELISRVRNSDKDWVWQATRKEIEVRLGKNSAGPSLAVLDFGSKENILREMAQYCQRLTIFPSRTSPEEILSIKPQGLLLTNGPGDPSQVKVSTQTVSSLIGKLPIFGICMGHQILSLALGGQTYKMRFGHRGSNHPIKDDLLKKIYMTSQNHGYAVSEESLPSDVKITHRNLNDQTVAGFYSQSRFLMGIQYHPEACPGPHDSQELFNFFANEVKRFYR
ncbi:MAG: glutamine-hydrolyzing carbamoyl-phosphate synthase small subunit [Bdellovibrionales bacterium]